MFRSKSGLGQHWQARNELKDYGLTCPLSRQYGGWIFIGIVGIVTVILVSFAKTWPLRWTGVDVITALFALIAVVLGYQQWRAARHEISLDTFYERLETTNKLLDQWPAARTLAAPWPRLKETTTVSEEDRYQCAMYIYRELDNLEYAIAKYQLGYMTPMNALRCLRTFCTRCRSSQSFCDLAELAIKKDSGYDDSTKEVVSKVLAKISSEVSLTISFPAVQDASTIRQQTWYPFYSKH